ncbi:MAG: hypothetical protein ACJ74Y_13335 [Bryobacteraceae bacterium]
MQINLFKNGKISSKSVTKVSISLAIAALFVTVAFAGPNRVERRIAFQGYLQGQETDVLQGAPPEAIAVNGDVKGLATHLGQFTLTYKVTVKVPEGSAVGSAELISGNGDRIITSLVGQGEPTDTATPNLNSIVEIHLITGGTGQFANAKGSFTVKRLVDLATATSFTSGSVQGRIAFPGPQRGDR